MSEKMENEFNEFRFGEKLFLAFDEFIDVFNDIFKRNPRNIIRLETNVSDSIISTKDFSLVSVFEVKGVRRVTSNKDLNRMANMIANQLKPFLKNKAHYVQFTMEFDPKRAPLEVKKNTNILKTTAKNMGLNLGFIFDDWENKLIDGGWVSYERVYVAIWTRPQVLTQHNLNIAKANQAKRVLENIFNKNGMNVESYLTEMLNKQKGFQIAVKNAFEAAKISINQLNVHEALRVMRGQIDPEATSKNWRPYLNGDEMVLKVKNRLDNMMTNEVVTYPQIPEQIVPREFEDENLQMTRVGENLHHPLIMTIPGQPEYFNNLLGMLNNKDFGWRLSFGINGGAPSYGLKSFLASIFKKTSDSNNLLVNALNELNEARKNGETLVEFKASFDTWVNAYEKNAMQKLKSQASEIITAVQGWGGAEVSDIIGNPTLGVLSTVTGLLDHIPSEGAGAPIEDVISMMPFSRPASVWEQGATIFRTGCGKIFPYQQGSKKQTAWVDIGCAPMGFGKSVTLNTLNFTFLFEPGLKSLPWLSTLDIGPSSKGMVDLIRLGLPEGQKHLAVYHRLTMDESNAVNPCDTPLCLRFPLKNQKTFLMNLLVLFGTPLDGIGAPNGIDDVAGRAIDLAYEKFSDNYSPKLYRKNTYVDVDNFLEKNDFMIDSETTWWEIVDFLFEKNEIYLASKAQREAVPLLHEIAALFSHPVIEKLYGEVTYNGDKMLKFFWNACIGAINKYSILAMPTRLDLSESRIVSLDLDAVALKGPGEPERQTAVMYMLGRHLVASKFFMMPDDVAHIENQKVREFHFKKINSIRNDPKRLNFDEVHRITKTSGSASAIKQIVADIETAIRESRKWKLHIGMYSQMIEDFPKEIRNLATSIYILGAGTEEEIEAAQEIFSLTPAECDVIRNINKPGPQGSSFLSIIKTDEGEIRQKLFNTLGSVMLWGFSSTWDDNRVRTKLLEHMPPTEAFKLLAKAYPGGTVGAEAERRTQAYIDKGQSIDVIDEIANELIDRYNRYQD
jgi:intracellular multiplication protein IcmB